MVHNRQIGTEMNETVTSAEQAEIQDIEVQKRFPKSAKIILIVIAAILALLLIGLIAVNIYARTAFSSFYEQAENEFAIPGIDSGFVPQDLDFYDMGQTWLFSGYMADGSASPVYKRYIDGTVSEMYVKNPDGTDYTGHGSGITSTDQYIYLTCDDGYLVIDARVFITAGEGESIQALAKVDMDFSPAFLNIENGELMAGNFYISGAYETPEEHHIDNADGTQNQAVMYAYPADESAEYGFASQADRVYSIPDQVQGICAAEDGTAVFSTSYGIAPSHLLVYDFNQLDQEGTLNADGRDVPLYVFDSRSFVADIVAPPMTEGIESHDGRIYICEESASNKYIFGKLYGAGEVYSVEI